MESEIKWIRDYLDGAHLQRQRDQERWREVENEIVRLRDRATRLGAELEASRTSRFSRWRGQLNRLLRGGEGSAPL
jgi:hypothetical protein